MASCYVMVEQSAGPLCGSRQDLNTGCAFPPWPGSYQDTSQSISLRLGSTWTAVAALAFVRKTCGEGLDGEQYSTLYNSLVVRAFDGDAMQSLPYGMWDYSPHAVDVLFLKKCLKYQRIVDVLKILEFQFLL